MIPMVSNVVATGLRIKISEKRLFTALPQQTIQDACAASIDSTTTSLKRCPLQAEIDDGRRVDHGTMGNGRDSDRSSRGAPLWIVEALAGEYSVGGCNARGNINKRQRLERDVDARIIAVFINPPSGGLAKSPSQATNAAAEPEREASVARSAFAANGPGSKPPSAASRHPALSAPRFAAGAVFSSSLATGC
ncbi:MAG TPA: hypothetical protein VJY34_22075 [Roseiarcus sp.]|nr:hypothetical protein [Roseiarcus sp.]